MLGCLVSGYWINIWYWMLCPTNHCIVKDWNVMTRTQVITFLSSVLFTLRKLIYYQLLSSIFFSHAKQVVPPLLLVENKEEIGWQVFIGGIFLYPFLPLPLLLKKWHRPRIFLIKLNNNTSRHINNIHSKIVLLFKVLSSAKRLFSSF